MLIWKRHHKHKIYYVLLNPCIDLIIRGKNVVDILSSRHPISQRKLENWLIALLRLCDVVTRVDLIMVLLLIQFRLVRISCAKQVATALSVCALSRDVEGLVLEVHAGLSAGTLDLLCACYC
jgi:hypothetical protein